MDLIEHEWSEAGPDHSVLNTFMCGGVSGGDRVKCNVESRLVHDRGCVQSHHGHGGGYSGAGPVGLGGKGLVA